MLENTQRDGIRQPLLDQSSATGSLEGSKNDTPGEGRGVNHAWHFTCRFREDVLPDCNSASDSGSLRKTSVSI